MKKINILKRFWWKQNKLEKILELILIFIFLFFAISLAIGCGFAGFLRLLPKFKETSFWTLALNLKYIGIGWLVVMLLVLLLFLFSIEKIGTKKTKGEKQEIKMYKTAIKQNESETLNIGYSKVIKKDLGILFKNLNKHTLIAGTTGSGKTYLCKNMVSQLINQNQKVIYLDGKGDKSLITEFKEKYGNNNVFVWKIGDANNSINIFKNLDNTQIKAKLITLLKYEQEYYSNMSENHLNNVFDILEETNQEINIDNILKYFDHFFINKLANEWQKINNEKPLPVSLLEMTKTESRDINGMRVMLKNIFNTFNGSFSDKGQSLWEIAKSYDVVLISIESLLYGEYAKRAADLILQEISILSDFKPLEIKMNVFIDELNVFTRTDLLINLMNKMRSFNFQFFLIFQDSNNFTTKQKIDLWSTISGNANSVISLNLIDSELIEKIATNFGTKEVYEYTQQIDYSNGYSNKGSKKIVNEFIFNPNIFRKLKIGECVLGTTLKDGTKLNIELKIKIRNENLNGI